MEEYEKTYREKMKALQQEIDDLHKQLMDMTKIEANVAHDMGLQGQNLNEFLQLVTVLKADIHKGAIAYKPLESALTATKSMVEAYIILLTTGTEIDVRSAGATLLQKVSWLKEYHTAAAKQLEPSKEYQAISVRHVPQGIQTC